MTDKPKSIGCNLIQQVYYSMGLIQIGPVLYRVGFGSKPLFIHWISGLIGYPKTPPSTFARAQLGKVFSSNLASCVCQLSSSHSNSHLPSKNSSDCMVHIVYFLKVGRNSIRWSSISLWWSRYWQDNLWWSCFLSRPNHQARQLRWLPL